MEKLLFSVLHVILLAQMATGSACQEASTMQRYDISEHTCNLLLIFLLNHYLTKKMNI